MVETLHRAAETVADPSVPVRLDFAAHHPPVPRRVLTGDLVEALLTEWRRCTRRRERPAGSLAGWLGWTETELLAYQRSGRVPC